MYRKFDFTADNNRVSVSYDYSLGHTLGETVISPSGEHSYIYIPKNASSEFKQLFTNWQHVNFQTRSPSKEYIVVLRDPTERWISAVAEFLAGTNSVIGKSNQDATEQEIADAIESRVVQNLLFDFVIFDSHTLPQCWYLQGLNLENIKFFYLDNTVVQRVAEYLDLEYQASQANNSLTNPKKVVIINGLKALLQNNAELQHKINVHYYADHKLFDRVKF